MCVLHTYCILRSQIENFQIDIQNYWIFAQISLSLWKFCRQSKKETFLKIVGEIFVLGMFIWTNSDGKLLSREYHIFEICTENIISIQ